MRKRPVRPMAALVLAAVLLLSLLPVSPPASAAAPQSAMQSYVEAMQPGWNLGNSLDAVGQDETAWGNPRITKELIQNIAAQGYKSIRIPVTWDAHIGSGPNYTINAAYMNRVKEVTQWALDANLYVMINVHHDSWVWLSKMENNRAQTLARYNALWTQIADAFKGSSNKLMFESVNEPRFTDGGTTDEGRQQVLLDELNNSFHQIVRSSGGNNSVRPLVISTLEASPSQERMTATYNTISKWNDKNIIATVHYYGFWPFSVNIAGYTTFNAEVQNHVTSTFDDVYNTFVARGIPVIVGEYGLLGFDKHTGVIEQGEQLKFFEYIGHYLKQKQITTMLWDNGQHFSRTSYQWANPDLFNMIKASWSGRSATASSDLVYVKKGAPAQDKSVTLNLNGRTLSSLTVNGTTLRSGTDYTLSGSTLTFKASRLSQLTSSGTLGKSAVITAKFSGGADWKFNVMLYQTPKLSNASGTTSSFSIPTSFNGDQLATMEAVYTTGGIAGPQNWTSFKEFETAFSPTSNSIKLQPAFFNDTNNGSVKLTFHFWSGEKVTYTITKNGTSVTGTAS